jgi:hypothetical protein
MALFASPNGGGGKMRHKKFKLAGLIGTAVAAFQAVSFAANPTITFTAGTAPQSFPQLDNTGGGAINSGSFSASTGNVLDVTGSNSQYIPGYATNIGVGGNGDSDNYVAIGGFSPSTDAIYVALKLDSGGSYIDPTTSGGIADINAIDTAINANMSNPNYGGPLASPITPQFANVFAGYDILLSFPDTFNPGATTRVTANAGSEQFDVGFDFSSYGGTGSPVTVTGFAVVPEPGCLGLLTAAGMLLLPRYRRRA